MTRTFSSEELVTLPRLDGAGAIALGTSLYTAFEDAQRLQRYISASVRNRAMRLNNALEELRAARTKSNSNSEDDTKKASKADRNIDSAWAALFTWLRGWSRLPYDPEESGNAKKILTVVFPDELKFTQLPYKLEWTESSTRLALITTQGFDKIIQDLGGTRFLANLQRAHDEYGGALGITAPAAETDHVTHRPQLDAFIAVLRSYVLQVTAFSEDGKEEAKTAHKLLVPLTEWQTHTESPVTVSKSAL